MTPCARATRPTRRNDRSSARSWSRPSRWPGSGEQAALRRFVRPARRVRPSPVAMVYRVEGYPLRYSKHNILWAERSGLRSQALPVVVTVRKGIALIALSGRRALRSVGGQRDVPTGGHQHPTRFHLPQRSILALSDAQDPAVADTRLERYPRCLRIPRVVAVLFAVDVRRELAGVAELLSAAACAVASAEPSVLSRLRVVSTLARIPVVSCFGGHTTVFACARYVRSRGLRCAGSRTHQRSLRSAITSESRVWSSERAQELRPARLSWAGVPQRSLRPCRRWVQSSTGSRRTIAWLYPPSTTGSMAATTTWRGVATAPM